jgi:hypothetical protein
VAVGHRTCGRRIGMVRNKSASSAEPIGLRDRYNSVSVGPGATAFTVIFDCANSPAQMRVAASKAAYRLRIARHGNPEYVRRFVQPRRGGSTRRCRI